MAKLAIDARLLEPEGEIIINENFNRVMKFIDNGGTGDGVEKTQVDFNATLENNGTAYSKGHQYLITSEFVGGELILGSKDINVVQTA